MTPNKKSKPPTKRKNSNKTLFVAIAIMAIVITAIGAYTILGNSGNQNQNATSTPTPGPSTSPGSSPTPDPLYEGSTKVLLHTSMGDITIALRNDKPLTTGNFINLVTHGTYNNTIFHRVISGFMIQGGDPTGTGYGDPSIPDIEDEIGTNNHNYYGTIAMANTGAPNSASSQFFINVANNNKIVYQDGSTFDGSYTVFGKVTSGMDVVMAISEVATNASDKPLQNVTLFGASVLP
jgi:cyclophilin family peptidyl-prolyl cis-trans isomerase